jgi:3-oxoacyl-[acyl-carrier-protein] synthase-3
MRGYRFMNDVYITRIGKFLPNEPVSNDEIESILGMVNGQPSRSRKIVLRQNGINSRYYAIDRQGRVTHNNAQLTAEAIKQLVDHRFTLQDIELLCCGTSTPDQTIPSHASMVHGILKNKPMEINSPSGICCSGMQAFKYGYLSVLSGSSRNAVCTGSETTSFALCARKYSTSSEPADALAKQPLLAFERDFLRWMLSDGAGALLMEHTPSDTTCLRVEWVESLSFANELGVCMYAGCQRQEDGTVRSYHHFDYSTVIRDLMLTLQQDVRLLNENIINYAVKSIMMVAAKRDIRPGEADYFVPHLSSLFFRKPLAEHLEASGLGVAPEKWFTNLDHIGNVGSASGYVALEELFNSQRLKKGQTIWLAVPESGRFMYVHALLTVC